MDPDILHHFKVEQQFHHVGTDCRSPGGGLWGLLSLPLRRYNSSVFTFASSRVGTWPIHFTEALKDTLLRLKLKKMIRELPFQEAKMNQPPALSWRERDSRRNLNQTAECALLNTCCSGMNNMNAVLCWRIISAGSKATSTIYHDTYEPMCTGLAFRHEGEPVDLKIPGTETSDFTSHHPVTDE